MELGFEVILSSADRSRQVIRNVESDLPEEREFVLGSVVVVVKGRQRPRGSYLIGACYTGDGVVGELVR